MIFIFGDMRKAVHVLIATLFIAGALNAQTYRNPAYPQGYFRWPLDLSPEIVANMGELRPNHWHMGLDMRTAQKVDQRVYAAADGYVAFAGVRPLSFGRFLIINHPNGLSTLYAHLNTFNPEIEAYVTSEQYRQESWAVELTIPAGKFPVKKGDFISYSGTTGGSQGPHVHFEIIDTRSGKRLNPLLFGMPLADNVPPVLNRLAMYDRSKSIYEQAPAFFTVKKTDSGYVLPRDPVIRTSLSRVSFGIDAFDRISGSPNRDGIYKAALYVDNILQTAFVIDSIGYEDTRYMNAQIDYRYKANGGGYLQHVSKMPGDRSRVYHTYGGDGTVLLADTLPHQVRIEIADAKANTINLLFALQRSSEGPVAPAPTGSFMPEMVNILEKPDFEVYMPEGCLYDVFTPGYLRSNSGASMSITAIHQLHNETVPVQEEYTVRLKTDKIIEDAWKDRLVLRRTGKGSSVQKTRLQGNWLTGKFRDFGSFQAFADLQPPSVNELGKGDTVNLSAARSIAFTPSDDFGVKSFRAELNGKWLRFTNDKGRTFIYIFDERCPFGTHHLKVTVEDIAGNVTTKEWWFKREAYVAPVKKAPVKKTPAKKAPVKKKGKR